MKRIILFICSVFLILSMLVTESVYALSVTSSSSGVQYEIYPLPQSMTYGQNQIQLTSTINIVVESTIDQQTKDFLEEVIESKQLSLNYSSSIDPNKSNVLLGTKGSNGTVDQYFTENITYDSDTFEEDDAYILSIRDTNNSTGTIAILGVHTDAVYYGVASLKMIIDQINNMTVRTLQIDDFSDTTWRGFIEGFYGFPWSHEDRISLMRFGGQFKMNSYIFAPKDDIYHNSQWRTLYPQEELEKIQELVEVGHETKTQFVWAIHPGFSMINWNNYQNELATLLAKLEQLYSVGVRQFGLFMDDISTSQSLVDKDRHVMLITDVANWAASKDDVRSLIYCPPFYNQSWTGNSGRPYLQALANVPENVDIMWTGSGVVSSVNQQSMQWPKDAHGRDPYVWLNWPVNDYVDRKLMLGKGEVLIPGTTNISGVVSNPMGHAELSKVSLFAVADYTWNVHDFDMDQSWLDSFDYIAPEVAEQFNTIAYHMSDPSPSGHGLVLEESENLKDQLAEFMTRIAQNQSIGAGTVGEDLLREFINIRDSIAYFRANLQNANMLEEITPWINTLNDVAVANIHAILSAQALENNDIQTSWEELAKSSNALEKSKTYYIQKLNANDVRVEAGAKRLVPFAQQLINSLDSKIYSEIDPSHHSMIPMASYGGHNSINNMVDGDLSTYVYYQINQVNGDWYGLDFGKTITVNNVKIVQGRNDTDHDIFQRGILEYSTDGQTWTAIGSERSGYLVTEQNMNIEARYIRYRLTHAGVPGGKPDLWTAIREFSVNENSGKLSIYSNLESTSGFNLSSTVSSIELTGSGTIELAENEYVGLKLTDIEKISSVQFSGSMTGLSLQYSENGVEWVALPANGSYPNLAYVRIINLSQQPLELQLNSLSVQLNKFLPSTATHNFSGIYSGSIGNVYDGDLTTKVWFNQNQQVGKYVQVDMGGIVDVENVAVVISDGEGDYLRNGVLQLSLDGQTWTTIHTFNNPGDRSLNFPEHEVPYRYLRTEVDHMAARYVRLQVTQAHGNWLALNEIIVNEGINRPGTDVPSLKVQPEGSIGYEASKALDGKLSTFYTPASTENGSFIYKLSNETQINQLIILQNPNAISQAQVSIRDIQGWHNVGTLSQAYNTISTANYNHVLELKIEWNSSTRPVIHEIITVVGDRPVETKPVLKIFGPESLVSGQSLELLLKLDYLLGNVYGIDFDVEYDSEQMEILNSVSMHNGVQLLATDIDQSGKARFILVGSGPDHPITDEQSLVKLTFRTNSVNVQETATIYVSRALLGDQAGNESTVELSQHTLMLTPPINPPSTDLNGDGVVTVADLAMIAFHYGKTTESNDWDIAKKADINMDGKINLEDMVIIARRIINHIL